MPCSRSPSTPSKTSPSTPGRSPHHPGGPRDPPYRAPPNHLTTTTRTRRCASRNATDHYWEGSLTTAHRPECGCTDRQCPVTDISARRQRPDLAGTTLPGIHTPRNTVRDTLSRPRNPSPEAQPRPRTARPSVIGDVTSGDTAGVRVRSAQNAGQRFRYSFSTATGPSPERSFKAGSAITPSMLIGCSDCSRCGRRCQVG